MEENLNEIRNNALIEIKSWNGFKIPFNESIIITNNKEVFRYYKYKRESKFLTENNIKMEDLYLVKKLSDDNFKKITKYIEEKIIGKSFEFVLVRDHGSTINVNYLDSVISIKNNNEINSELRKLIKEM